MDRVRLLRLPWDLGRPPPPLTFPCRAGVREGLRRCFVCFGVDGGVARRSSLPRADQFRLAFRKSDASAVRRGITDVK